jgi:hypothetical protein
MPMNPSRLPVRKPGISGRSFRFLAVAAGYLNAQNRELTFGKSWERMDVSVHRAPHLLCYRALEVQKYVCAPDALHLRHPVTAYN